MPGHEACLEFLKKLRIRNESRLDHYKARLNVSVVYTMKTTSKPSRARHFDTHLVHFNMHPIRHGISSPEVHLEVLRPRPPPLHAFRRV